VDSDSTIALVILTIFIELTSILSNRNRSRRRKVDFS